jgi:Fe-S cluster assembly scaffold protein SufB
LDIIDALLEMRYFKITMFNTRQLEILKILNLDLEEVLKLQPDQKKLVLQKSYQKYQNQIKGTQISSANTYPTIVSASSTAVIEHEASTSRINQQVLEFLESRGLKQDQAISLVVSGYCRDVLQNLPFEFAVEARNLLQMKIEGF